ncbi:Hypothetical protein PBC10988_13970 [Planctomycetales bacterium 10988]|nr:Hypothetical protein PBC10988_13970 [Planctomycetales bacterium 10988]
MARRDNLYEAAFEAFLREETVPYIAVDETKRTLCPGHSLKSLDFLISPPQGMRYLVDVKGRNFPTGSPGQYWKNWLTAEDLEALSEWEKAMGTGFVGLIVFAYRLTGRKTPLPWDQLFFFRGQWYGFLGVTRQNYQTWAKPISPKWQTLAIPTEEFRRQARPLQEFLLPPVPAARCFQPLGLPR